MVVIHCCHFVIWMIGLSHFWAFVDAQTVGPDECATGVHAIFARGEGFGSDFDVLNATSDLVLDQIPGSTSLALPYAHANLLVKPVDVHDGALMFQDYIRQYVASCPDSKLLLLGYSMGAIAMMDALCGTSSTFLDPVPGPLEANYSANSKSLEITLFRWSQSDLSVIVKSSHRRRRIWRRNVRGEPALEYRQLHRWEGGE